MDYIIARKDGEINYLLNKCTKAEQEGETAYSAMTYEQGIVNAIAWLTGLSNVNPLELSNDDYNSGD